MTSSIERRRLAAYTEDAIRATEAGKLIPPIVYLPSRLRGHNVRITVDNIRITTDPPTIKENHIRIAEADPLGFLIALMHGQPVPTFEITEQGSIKTRYEIADLDRREQIARFLAHKVTIRGGQNYAPSKQSADIDNDPASWDEIVERRSEAERAAAQSEA